MSYKAEVIKDSVAPSLHRLTTVVATFPRIILPEVLTHRVFTRNTSSSRAIPVNKVIAQVKTNPAGPSHWGLNKPGMSADEENNAKVYIERYLERQTVYDDAETLFNRVLSSVDREDAWLHARDMMVKIAESFRDSKYHKQIVNRLLEPFIWTNMVISSTNWNNFYNLRIADDAQPEIKIIANHIKESRDVSIPTFKDYEQWHLPFVSKEEEENEESYVRQFAVARLARVSYNNHDGTPPGREKDLDTYSKVLNEDGSLHGSCFEHIARPLDLFEKEKSNFRGWHQWRHDIDKNSKEEEIYTGPIHYA